MVLAFAKSASFVLKMSIKYKIILIRDSKYYFQKHKHKISLKKNKITAAYTVYSVCENIKYNYKMLKKYLFNTVFVYYCSHYFVLFL